MKKIKIGNKIIGDGEPCFIVAEIGCNHDGKLARAKQMIDAAVKAKCDAVKFQLFSADKSFNKYLKYERRGWMALLKKLELPKKWLPVLSNYCQKKGIIFFSSVGDEEKADWLEAIDVPAYKIPSYELTHLPLIKYIAKKKKPIILSSGIADKKEIKQAIETIYKEGNKNVILTHCVSAYPTKFEDLNLKTIPYYKKKFNIPTGLSDHSLGILSSSIAAALGANIVEKHITLDKKLPGPDHYFALDKKEIKQWVSQIRDTEKALGKIKKQPAPGEKNEVLWRRAIWAKKDIAKGTKFKKETLMVVRPSPVGSLAPKEIYKVLNKKAKKDIKKGELITSNKLL